MSAWQRGDRSCSSLGRISSRTRGSCFKRRMEMSRFCGNQFLSPWRTTCNRYCNGGDYYEELRTLILLSPHYAESLDMRHSPVQDPRDHESCGMQSYHRVRGQAERTAKVLLRTEHDCWWDKQCHCFTMACSFASEAGHDQILFSFHFIQVSVDFLPIYDLMIVTLPASEFECLGSEWVSASVNYLWKNIIIRWSYLLIYLSPSLGGFSKAN